MAKYTEEQLIQICDIMISSGIENIRFAFPDRLSFYADEKDKLLQVISDSINVIGWNLSILYAQITDDGMGTGDALDASGIDDAIETWANKFAECFADSDGVENYDVDFFHSTAPNSLPYAKRFVKVAFADYLKETQ